MVSNRPLSYHHPYQSRSSFPNMAGRGTHMVKRVDEPMVKSHDTDASVGGDKGGDVTGPERATPESFK